MEESTLVRTNMETPPGAPRERDPGRLARGSALGRYVVLERLGAGGMGAVYAAFDPQLDRRVALKVLHAEHARRDATGPARLLREAQAMARLTHPNVVTVHDVGLEGAQLFVAMELVDGHTLKAWLRESERSVAVALAACIAAGRGLVAAHAQGLVHRDFKPDNVMVHRDGRVLVMDFGLARGSDGAASSSSGTSDLHVSLSAGELTQTGSLLGTPAYMSPEQFAGEVADERSDQFAFCVTVWEAVFGERPFCGDSLATLSRAVRSGKLREPAKPNRVPAHVRTALRRGLLADPGERHASMDALLALLSPPARGIGRPAIAAGAVAAAVTTVAWSARAQTDPCTGATERAAAHWSDSRSLQIAEAFAATGVPFAPSTWTRASEHLDGFFDQWSSTRTEVCRATHVLHEQSAARLDVRMDCLDDALNFAAATLDELAHVDAELVPRALPMVQSLAAPADCRARTHDAAPAAALSAAERIILADARRWRATAHARVSAGRYGTARDAAAAGLAVLVAFEAPEIRSDLLNFRAKAEENLEQLDAAHATLLEGLRVATRANLARPEADLWISLMTLTGSAQKRSEAALALALPAQLAVERTGDPQMRMKLQDATGAALWSGGQASEALPYFERALSIIDEAGLPPRETAIVQNNLGLALYDLARYDESLAHHRAAYVAQLAMSGEDHPAVAIDLSNLGRVYAAKGDVEQARDHYERSAALRERLLGHDSAAVADAWLNLGILEHGAGDDAGAERRITEAKRIYVATLGPDHPHVGLTLLTLGNIARTSQRLDEALKLNDEALAILRAHYGIGHAKTIPPMGNRATILMDLGRNAEAVTAYQEVIALEQRAVGPDHVDLAYALMGLAQALIQLGRGEESVPPAQRAHELRERAGIDPRQVAETALVLAMAKWAAGTERDQALQLARDAAYTTRPDGPTASALHDQINTQIDAWQAERDAAP